MINALTYREFSKQWRSGCDKLPAHTSGSTGAPKRILLSRELMIESAMRTIRHFQLNEYSRLHSCISAKYIGGKMMFVRSEICGAKFSYEPPSNTPLFTENADTIYDLVSVVPSQVPYILKKYREAGRISNIKNLLIGGQKVDDCLRNDILESGVIAWESYGMTETSSHIALKKITDDSQNRFLPLEGINVSLSNCDTLRIQIPTQGIDIQTNDIARIFPDGSFEILGRADNVIISGGVKIIPEKVENLLKAYISENFIILGKKDAKWGERPVIVTESETLTMDGIKNILKEIPSIYRPVDVVCKKFSYTESGKLDRLKMRRILCKE